MPYLKGLDVSHHNSDAPKKPIDWPLVKAAGYEFVFIKCSEGTTYRDPFFEQNWKGAGDAGLLRSPYHYWRAAKDPISQVAFFRSCAPEGELPQMLDVEDPLLAAGKDLMVPLVPFLSHMAELFVRPSIFYSFPYYVIDRGNPANAWLSELPLLISHITASSEPLLPKAWTTWLFWQHSWKARVPGIVGDVDEDICKLTIGDLRAWGIGAPAPQPQPGGVELIVPHGTAVKITERS